MRYLVCTTDGELVERLTEHYDDLTVIRREVGEPGFDIALSANGFGVFVNDEGHLNGMARNPVGTCLAATIARRPMSPLAGPVVFTGWQDTHGTEWETRSLSNDAVWKLQNVHRDLRVLLGYDEGELSSGATGAWQRAVRSMAEHATNAPTPTIEILTGDDALRHLLGGAS